MAKESGLFVRRSALHQAQTATQEWGCVAGKTRVHQVQVAQDPDGCAEAESVRNEEKKPLAPTFV